MADLIDRKAAIRLLRGECVAKYPLTFSQGLFAAADEIAKLPAVDAEPVVRCKDCEFYELHALACKFPSMNGYIVPNGFCSHGKRRC